MSNTTLIKVLIYLLVECVGRQAKRLVISCSKLALREYKRGHNNVARMIHWKLCEKFNLKKSEKWYLQNPQTVSEKVNHKLIWGMNIQCDIIIMVRRPGITTVNKMEKTAIIIDVAIPGDKIIIDKKNERIEKYQNLSDFQ